MAYAQPAPSPRLDSILQGVPEARRADARRVLEQGSPGWRRELLPLLDGQSQERSRAVLGMAAEYMNARPQPPRRTRGTRVVSDVLRKAEALLGRVRGMGGEHEIPAGMGAILWERQESELAKAASHKYMRRVPTGNPARPWRYFYTVAGGHGLGHEEDLVEGAAFKLEHEGKAGHFHITGRTPDGKITVRHDETGHTATLDPAVFVAMLHRGHAQAIHEHTERMARDLAAVRERGSARQRARLEAEAGKYGHTRHLVEPAKDPRVERLLAALATAEADAARFKREAKLRALYDANSMIAGLKRQIREAGGQVPDEAPPAPAEAAPAKVLAFPGARPAAAAEEPAAPALSAGVQAKVDRVVDGLIGQIIPPGLKDHPRVGELHEVIRAWAHEHAQAIADSDAEAVKAALPALSQRLTEASRDMRAAPSNTVPLPGRPGATAAPQVDSRGRRIGQVGERMVFTGNMATGEHHGEITEVVLGRSGEPERYMITYDDGHKGYVLHSSVLDQPTGNGSAYYFEDMLPGGKRTPEQVEALKAKALERKARREKVTTTDNGAGIHEETGDGVWKFKGHNDRGQGLAEIGKDIKARLKAAGAPARVTTDHGWGRNVYVTPQDVPFQVYRPEFLAAYREQGDSVYNTFRQRDQIMTPEALEFERRVEHLGRSFGTSRGDGWNGTSSPGVSARVDWDRALFLEAERDGKRQRAGKVPELPIKVGESAPAAPANKPAAPAASPPAEVNVGSVVTLGGGPRRYLVVGKPVYGGKPAYNLAALSGAEASSSASRAEPSDIALHPDQTVTFTGAIAGKLRNKAAQAAIIYRSHHPEATDNVRAAITGATVDPTPTRGERAERARERAVEAGTAAATPPQAPAAAPAPAAPEAPSGGVRFGEVTPASTRSTGATVYQAPTVGEVPAERLAEMDADAKARGGYRLRGQPHTFRTEQAARDFMAKWGAAPAPAPAAPAASTAEQASTTAAAQRDKHTDRAAWHRDRADALEMMGDSSGAEKHRDAHSAHAAAGDAHHRIRVNVVNGGGRSLDTLVPAAQAKTADAERVSQAANAHIAAPTKSKAEIEHDMGRKGVGYMDRIEPVIAELEAQRAAAGPAAASAQPVHPGAAPAKWTKRHDEGGRPVYDSPSGRVMVIGNPNGVHSVLQQDLASGRWVGAFDGPRTEALAMAERIEVTAAADTPEAAKAREAKLVAAEREARTRAMLGTSTAGAARAPSEAPRVPPPAPAPEAPAAHALGVQVSRTMVDGRLAQAAHSGTSWTPDKRAEQEQAGFVSHMNELAADLTRYATTPEKRAILKEELERYRDGYLKRLHARLSAQSRTLSPMITGPSNFPTRRNNKANEVERKRLDELVEWMNGARRAIRNKIDPPSISSDRDDAHAQLVAKLDKLKRTQETMKAANAIVRAKGTVEDKVPKLVALGMSERGARALFEPDFAGRIGFPDYSLKNNLAEIKRLEGRVGQVAKETSTASSEHTFGDVRVEDSAEDNRIKLFYPGKPDADTIAKLKRHGFKWSPGEGAWQRFRNDNTRAVLRYHFGMDLGGASASGEGEPMQKADPARVERARARAVESGLLAGA